MPTITLTFADGDRVRVASKAGETILAAARRGGVPLNSDCEVGDCQTCRATCLAGKIEYDEFACISLNGEETDRGEILPCVAAAVTDIEIRIPYERERLVPARTFSIKVEEIRRLSTSVVRVSARMLGLTPLKFLPGQYINLQVPGTSQWRSYSMANASSEEMVLEFYVRLLDDGVMSRYLVERAAPGDVIQCSGPRGTFYLRGGARSILMVAGGTGVAPMASMLRQIVASGEQRAVTLCFGVNEASELFLVDELTGLTKALPKFDLRIAIAQGSPAPGFHSGLVTDLIDAESAANADVYLCGPPAMTDRARAIATTCGTAVSSIFSERFLPSGGTGD